MTEHGMVERLGNPSSPIMKVQLNKTKLLKPYTTPLDMPLTKAKGETGPWKPTIMPIKKHNMT
jgi:hypothetical protein